MEWELFSEQINNWYNYYSSSSGVQHYAINSLLFLTTVREKYVTMYERFLNQLRQYSQAIRVLSKGYLPITLLSTFKIECNFTKGERNHTKVKQRLWYINQTTVFVLWHEVSNIWNRQQKKFDSSISSICTSTKSETLDTISIRNSSGTYYR